MKWCMSILTPTQAEKEAQKIVQKGTSDFDLETEWLLTIQQPENVCDRLDMYWVEAPLLTS